MTKIFKDDLDKVDFSNEDLSFAIFRGDVTRCNFSFSKLRGVTFDGEFLENKHRFTRGNYNQVRNFDFERYPVVMSKCGIAIGCQQHTYEQWKQFNDDIISLMSKNAPQWWDKHRDVVLKIYEGLYL